MWVSKLHVIFKFISKKTLEKHDRENDQYYAFFIQYLI